MSAEPMGADPEGRASSPHLRPATHRMDAISARDQRMEAQLQLRYELFSGASGVALAFFMWGHMFLVGSILFGTRGFDTLAGGLEDIYVAQPTVFVISALFLLHAAMASRKIPAQLRQRRRLQRIARKLRATSGKAPGHVESSLWVWQVWTGMIVLVFGSFHLVLVGIDVFTDLFGIHAGIEAVSTQARVGKGLWLVYALLLLCVEFHASTGLYRFAIKWGVGARLGRSTLHRAEQVLLAVFLGLGGVTLTVLAGWMDPPLAFLIGDAG